MRRLPLFFLVFALLCPRAEALFMDVPVTHPHTKAIDVIQKAGIIEGYDMDTFGPDSFINRGEFVKILAGALFPADEIDSCIAKNGSKFPDVPVDVWYAKFVCAAAEHDFIRGYPDGTYGPERFINTAEASVILTRAFIGKQDESGVWYRSSLEALAQKNNLPMTLHDLSQGLRRGQMAEMVYRLRENVADQLSLSVDQLEERTRTSAPASYNYDWQKHAPMEAIGTKVGGMTLTKIKSPDVIFEGSIVVTGRYEDSSDSEGMAYNGVCVDQFDASSIDEIPGYPRFCLTPNEETKKIPPGSRGRVTLLISKITRSHCECEASDTATVKSVLNIAPDPRDEVSCKATGGDWQAHAIYRIYVKGSESVTERGWCYPAENPYAGKMTAFDGCATFPSYSGKFWYADFKKQVIDAGIQLDDVSEVCAALDDSLVVMLIPGTRKKVASEVWRYRTASRQLEQATGIRGDTGAFHMSEFQKREGHIIPLIDQEDIPGLCRSETHGEYNYVTNALRDFGGGCVEMFE